MNYFVKRGEQRLGPYSLADLQQRVATLSILPTDLAQSEGMTDWAPISQIIGNIPAPAPAPVGTVYGGGSGTVYGGNVGTVYGGSSGTVYGGSGTGPGVAPGMAVDAVPLPPNLHWVLVLLLNFFPFFSILWTILLANWARKLNGNNNVLILVALYPAGIISGYVLGTSDSPLQVFLLFGGLICFIVGVFMIRSAMLEYYNSTENIGLRLSGVMTFFFNIIYLQYHVNRLHRWKQTGVLS